MNHFILYGTLGCHLCEQAEALLTSVVSGDDIVECVDISDSDALLERYSMAIPVLHRLGDAAELRWPFDAARARQFLSGID